MTEQEGSALDDAKLRRAGERWKAKEREFTDELFSPRQMAPVCVLKPRNGWLVDSVNFVLPALLGWLWLPFVGIAYNKWGASALGVENLTPWLLLPPVVAVVVIGALIHLPFVRDKFWLKVICRWAASSVAVYWLLHIVQSNYAGH